MNNEQLEEMCQEIVKVAVGKRVPEEYENVIQEMVDVAREHVNGPPPVAALLKVIKEAGSHEKLR